jgi:hypothetical protein
VDVNGKRSRSEIYELEPLSPATPIILPATDITYNKATLCMKLDETFVEEEVFDVGFQYWAEGNKTPEIIAADINDMKDGVLTAKAEGLSIMTKYTVKAVVSYLDKVYESQETETFTTSTPIDNMTVKPSYTEADFSAIVMDEYDVENVTVKFIVDKDKNFSNPVEILADLEEEFEGIVATAQADATQGITDAATAQAAAEAADAKAQAARGAIDTLNNTVSSEVLPNIASLTGKVSTTEDNITTIQGIINSGEGKTIRDDVTTLQELTGDSNKGNEALYTKISTVAALIEDGDTGLAATKAIADKNAADIGTLSSDVAAIKADYLKEADEFIFNCGSSTTITHKNSEV